MILSEKSIAKLVGVHPILVALVHETAKDYTDKFVVFSGVRTLTEQEVILAAGNTTTLNSKHIIQSTGYSHAVDLVPIINGAASWAWKDYYPLATAVQIVAIRLNIADKITWGGVWDRTLNNITNIYTGPADYKIRTGRTFIDGPHFQWN